MQSSVSPVPHTSTPAPKRTALLLPRLLVGALISFSLALSPLAQALGLEARVISVVDGDTVVVSNKANSEFQITCQSVDAPELNQAFGAASKQRLSDLVLGKTVTVEVRKRDSGGNLVGKIMLDGRDVCLDQVSAGYASRSQDAEAGADTSDRQAYAAAESGARAAGAGLWASADAVSPGQSRGSSESGVPASTTQASPTAAGRNSTSGAPVNVRGHLRKDGTYVDPHMRTAPNGTVNDNWSTVGNVNPITGKPGTKPRSWFAKNWWWATPLLGGALYLGVKSFSKSTGGGGSIRCNDGTFSNAQNRQGACSHHGGIAPGF